MKVEFHPAADSELRAAAKYYNDRVSGLGAEFLAEVEKACLRLGEHQALGPRLDAMLPLFMVRSFARGQCEHSGEFPGRFGANPMGRERCCTW